MKKTPLFAVFIVPVIFLIYSLFTLGDYGINWDEPYHFRRGQAFLHYFLTGEKTYDNIPRYPPLKGTSDSSNFRDSEKHFQEVIDNPSLSDLNFRRSYYQDQDWNGEYHIDMEDPYGHPPLNGIMAATFNKVFYQKLGILGDLESYHLFGITIASLLIFVVGFFMWKEFGIIESAVSSLVLSTYPLFLGEQHFNIKDPIVASFYTLTLITFYLFIKKQKFSWGILSVVFFALGLSTKFNIVFISIPIFIWLVLYFYKKTNVLQFVKKFWSIIFFAPLIIFTIFVGSFPTLWKNPFWGIKRILDYYLQVGYSAPSQPNKYYLFNVLNTYPITWIFYTTPIPTILIALSSLFFTNKLLKKKSFSLLLILSLATIIGRISLFGALSYGGVRLIMEYIPLLAMLCGIVAGLIYKKFTKSNKLVFILLIIIAFIPTVVKLVKIHPNENVFFNYFAGGLAGAKEKQINSWGNSNGNAYYPALKWLNENAEQNAMLTIPVGSISNIPRFKLRDDISLSFDYWSGPAHGGEYVLELTYDYTPMKWYSLSYLNDVMKPIYEVKVDEVAIAKVWKNGQEYVDHKYKNEKTVSTRIYRDKDNQFISLTLPNSEKIMQIDIIQPIKDCEPTTTGHVDTSIDSKNWTRETEDITREQLKHHKLKELESEFTFYFVGREAKYIRFHPKNTDACLFNSTYAKVTVLDN